MSDAHSTEYARQLELAWAAGFFDGEGHTGLQLPHNGKYAYVYLTVPQVERSSLDRFKAAVGGLGNVSGPRKTKGSPIHVFRTCGTPARKILELLWPYLGEIKRAQATEALAGERNKGGVQNAKRTHCPRGHPYDDKNTALMRNKRNGKMFRECRACWAEKGAERKKTDLLCPEKRTHCPQGHEYATEGYRNSAGRRVCRICQQAASRRYEARQRARKVGE